MVLNSLNSSQMHNNLPPSEWKNSPKVLNDISNVVTRNSQLTPKEIQKSLGMDYSPMEKSIAAANIDRLRCDGRTSVSKEWLVACYLGSPLSFLIKGFVSREYLDCKT